VSASGSLTNVSQIDNTGIYRSAYSGPFKG